MEYIKILIGKFLIEQNFLQALNLTQDIINAEDTKNNKLQKELDWIKNNTTDTLRIPFVVVETYVSKNAIKQLHYTVEVQINDDPKEYQEFDLIDLIIEMKKAYEKMRSIVTIIAKKYSMDIPFDKETEIEIPVIK